VPAAADRRVGGSRLIGGSRIAMARHTPPRRPKKPTPDAEACRAHDVLLEQIDSKMDAVIEVATSTKTELRAEMAAMEQRLTDRVTRVEEAITMHSGQIRRLEDAITTHTAQLRHLQHDLEEMRH
jgi:chromosome segregation ATPase